MRLVVRSLFLLTLFCTSACLSASRGDEMQAEIEALKAEQNALGEQLRERERTLAEMVTAARSETESLGAMIEQAKETLQRNDAATGIDLQAMRDELNQLRGAAEKLEFQLARVEQDVALFKEDVEVRLEGAGSDPLPDDPAEAIALADAKLEAKDGPAARRLYTAFARKFPNDERLERAYFGAGEAYFLDRQYVGAIGEYRRILQSPKRGRFYPSAALRIGQAFRAMGRCENAKPFFETVIKEFGSTQAARQAKIELDGCGDA